MKFLHPKTSNMKKPYRVIIHIIFGLAIATFFALIFGYFVQLLWSLTVVPIFNITPITYLQGAGLVLLSRLLFGGLGPKHGKGFRGHRFHKRCTGNGDEQLSQPSLLEVDPEKGLDPAIKYHYNEFWKKEGKQAFKDYLADQKNGDKQ